MLRNCWSLTRVSNLRIEEELAGRDPRRLLLTSCGGRVDGGPLESGVGMLQLH